jgi:hypothetical protein
MIDKAKLQLTKCAKCVGCERLNDDSFRGDDQCKQFKQGIRSLESLKRAYNDTLNRIMKATPLMDDPNIPDEKKDKWEPEFLRLKQEINSLVTEIRVAGHEMTEEEKEGGFK